ncbi:hypothetical protein [Paenibacillus elgii]|uniref:hypothetical protein n=1 Tax=Paenibacillus elgii TaxID=189691 RepID=UPI00203B59D3|nr:hypothetical protein [Paenibacillus elgii]MCM3272958.1 hypothetical protein [Paenibacillus elgii]
MVAFGGFAGTTNQTIVYDRVAHCIVISNEGTGDVTITAGTAFNDLFTFTVKPGVVLDERIDRFDRVRVVSNGSAYTGYVL